MVAGYTIELESKVIRNLLLAKFFAEDVKAFILGSRAVAEETHFGSLIREGTIASTILRRDHGVWW